MGQSGGAITYARKLDALRPLPDPDAVSTIKKSHTFRKLPRSSSSSVNWWKD
jgi:hypothetical protein